MTKGRRKNELPAWFVLGAVLLIFTGLAPFLDWASDNLAGSTDRKFQQADRVAYYRVTPTDGPRFLLTGREHELNLVTHLHVTRGTDYEPMAQWQYGLHLEIRTPEQSVFWTRDIYTRSRQSKEDWREGAWQRENIFALDPGIQLTDDRVFRVTLPSMIPAESVLHLSLMAGHRVDEKAPDEEFSAALVRAYERAPRNGSQQWISRYAMSPRQRRNLIRNLTYRPWRSLATEQQEASVRFQRNRLPAMGEVGVDYETETVYFSGFRRERELLAAESGSRIFPRQPVAFNVRGPVVLELRARLLEAQFREDAPISVFDLGADGNEQRWELGLTGNSDWYRRFEVGPGAHTLRLSTTTESGAQAWLSTVDGSHNDKRTPVLPDTARVPIYQLRPKGQPPIVITTPPSHTPSPHGPESKTRESQQSRAFKLSVRRMEVASSEAPPIPNDPLAVVHYRFLGTDNEQKASTLGEGDIKFPIVPFDHSFERIRAPAGNESHPSFLLSESASARLLAPVGTDRVEFSGASSLGISVHTLMPALTDTRQLSEPYSRDQLTGTRWRFAPIEARSWHPLRPYNHAQLAQLKRAVLFEAQTRLERVTKEQQTSPQDTKWDALEPRRRGPGQLVLERMGSGSSDSNPERVAYLRLRPGRTHRLALPPNEALRVLYRSSSSGEALGQSVHVNWDKEPVTEQPLVLRRANGSWTFDNHPVSPTNAPRSGTLRIDTDAPNLDFYARTVAPTTTHYLPRRLFQSLGRRPMSLTVVKKTNEPVTVNAVAYLPARATNDLRPLPVTITVDDGHPPRRSGVPVERITLGKRTISLPEATATSRLVFLDKSSNRGVNIHRFPITLGDDLAPGRYKIDIALEGRRSVWWRFFMKAHGSDTQTKEATWIRP